MSTLLPDLSAIRHKIYHGLLAGGRLAEARALAERSLAQIDAEGGFGVSVIGVRLALRLVTSASRTRLTPGGRFPRPCRSQRPV